jgi:hypothetical protein
VSRISLRRKERWSRFTKSNYTHGYWLETPIGTDNKGVYVLYGDAGCIYGNNQGKDYANNNVTNGIRPVIEVPLSDIDY